jgi:hypothetical protein
VPEELEDEARKKFPGSNDVGVNIINKTNEDYNPGFVAFQSQGFSLGSSSVAVDASFSSARPALIQVDNASPVTTIQVVSHSGQRLRVQANHSNTVFDLYQHIMR